MGNQVFYTIISGTLVFTLGQIIQKFLLEPLKEYAKVVGTVDNKLKFYANILTSDIFKDDRDTLVEITDTMRNLSCDIESSYKQIPCTNLLSKVGITETQEAVATVAKDLIFLSNAGGRGRDKSIDKCEEKIEEIRTLLGIKTLN
jgi:hypothetical protein